nr:mucoidy inhibitor MuiA family protein [uncultured Holophaga sp.]
MNRAWLLPVLSSLLAAQQPIPATAPIQRVRVHPDEAWVTRMARVRLPGPGTHRVLLEALPPGLRVEDLQISAKGPAGMRLGDLTVSSEPREVTETPEWKKLEADREALRVKRDNLESQGEAALQELTFLKGLQAGYDKEISARMTGSLPSAEGILTLSMVIQKRSAELLTGERARKRELEKLSQEEARLDAELRKRASERRTAPSRVTVELSTVREGAAEVELSYRTRQARWKPLYEARLSEDRKRLDLALYAAVTQTTGESWEGIRLEISNARPSLDLAVGEYTAGQEVGWQESRPRPLLRKAAVSREESRMNIQAYAPAPPPAAEPMEDAALEAATESGTTTLEEASGLAATFAVDGLKEVPSDGEPHRFKVMVKDLAPALSVFTAPRLEPTAYLMAKFQVPGQIPLFPGAPVVRFAGSQRLGEAPLALPPSGQPFSLGFGPYKALRVSFRKVDHKLETVGAFTKERQWTLLDRMELSNDGAAAVDVVVQDRMLKPTSDRVQISLGEGFTPGWTETVPGVRSWTFTLAPKGQKTLELPVNIRAPKEGIVTGVE